MGKSTLAVRLLVVLCLLGGEQHAGVAARHSKGKRAKGSAGRSRSSGGGTPREDAWAPVRAPLEAVLEHLYVPDRAAALTSPEAAAAALGQAMWAPKTDPATLVEPVFALGMEAATAQHGELVAATLYLLEDLANLISARAEGMEAGMAEQLHALWTKLSSLYTKQYVPLTQVSPKPQSPEVPKPQAASPKP